MAERVIYTGGTFDLFHWGHVQLLKACRDMAGPSGRVWVGLNTDEFVEAYKGHRPIQSYGERALVLEACRYVDVVVPNIGGADSRPSIELAMPDIIAIGDDWYGRDYLGQLGLTQAWLDERLLQIAYVPRTMGQSSTHLRSQLSEFEPEAEVKQDMRSRVVIKG